MPATLAGQQLRMKIGKTGTGVPLRSTVSSSPIRAAGSGVVGNSTAETS
jgi:hypothetical protein